MGLTKSKWDPFREMEDMFDRYTRSAGWPRRGSQEFMELKWKWSHPVFWGVLVAIFILLLFWFKRKRWL